MLVTHQLEVTKDVRSQRDEGSDKFTTAPWLALTNLPVGCEMLQAPVVVAHHKFLCFCVRPGAGRSGVAHISALQKGSYQPLVVVLSIAQ